MSFVNDSEQNPVNGKFEGRWIGEAWALWKKDARVYIGATLAIVSIFEGASYGAPYLYGYLLKVLKLHSWYSQFHTATDHTIIRAVCELLLSPVTGWTHACMVGLALRQVRGEKIVFWDAFSGGKYWLRMTAVVVGYILLRDLGLLMCLLGVFYTLRRPLPAFAMVADGVPLREAWGISMGVTGQESEGGARLIGSLLLLQLAGYCTLGLGLLAVLPMTAIVSVLAYRDMVGFRSKNEINPFGSPVGVWPPAPIQLISEPSDKEVTE